MPVKLPPGRAQLSASLAPTGSPLNPNTTGFGAFDRSMAIAMNSCVTTTSGSDASAACVVAAMSSRPVAQNVPSFRLRPSTQPRSRRQARKDSR